MVRSARILHRYNGYPEYQIFLLWGFHSLLLKFLLKISPSPFSPPSHHVLPTVLDRCTLRRVDVVCCCGGGNECHGGICIVCLLMCHTGGYFRNICQGNLHTRIHDHNAVAASWFAPQGFYHLPCDHHRKIRYVCTFFYNIFFRILPFNHKILTYVYEVRTGIFYPKTIFKFFDFFF